MAMTIRRRDVAPRVPWASESNLLSAAERQRHPTLAEGDEEEGGKVPLFRRPFVAAGWMRWVAYVPIASLKQLGRLHPGRLGRLIHAGLLCVLSVLTLWLALIATVFLIRLASIGPAEAGWGTRNSHQRLVAQLFVYPRHFSLCTHPLPLPDGSLSTQTANWDDALELCLRTENCTVVSRQFISGTTNLYRAYKPVAGKHSKALIMIMTSYMWVWLRQNAVVGGCGFSHHWGGRAPLIFGVHEEAFRCRGEAVRAFEFSESGAEEAQHPPCTGSLRLSVTDGLHSAAATCLFGHGRSAEAPCSYFGRHESSGRTLYCFESPSGKSDHASPGAEPRDTALPYRAGKSAAGWVYGCRVDRGAASSCHSSVAGKRVTLPIADAAAEDPDAIPQFNSMQGHMIFSAQQILTYGWTPSHASAALACAGLPHCTAFTRNEEGMTWLGQGYMTMQHSGPNSARSLRSPRYTFGIRRGCEHYQERMTATRREPPHCTKEMGAASAALSSSASSSSSSSSCPSGLHEVAVRFASTVPMPDLTVCDECIKGVCRELEAVQPPRLFRAVSDALQAHAQTEMAAQTAQAEPGAAPFGAMNPAVFEHGGSLCVMYRATDALRCRGRSYGWPGTWDVDVKQDRFVSRVGLCMLVPSSSATGCGDGNCSEVMHADACIMLPDIPDITNMDHEAMEIDNETFLGQEDPRGFSFRGRLYILVNIGVKMLKDPEKLRLRRMFLLAMEPDGGVKETLMVQIPGVEATGDVKNVVPIVDEAEGTVGLVHSFVPYKICLLETNTGDCTAVDMGRYLEGPDPTRVDGEMAAAFAKNGHLRGSTAFVHTEFGFLGLVHRKQDLELGRIYSHKWILLDSPFPHIPVWLSDSFRLPSSGVSASEDIQYAAGLHVDAISGTALISYGVADCFSSFARVQLPWEDIARIRGPGPPAPLVLLKPVPAGGAVPAPRSKTPDAATPVRILWQAPVTDITGFATVTRALAKLLAQDPDFSLLLQDTAAHPHRFEPEENADIYASILKSNLELIRDPPEVVVRMGWEPNLQPEPTGHGDDPAALVIYLPWEFGPIPSPWVSAINAHAAEVWATTPHVAEGFLRSGVDASRVGVVGHGVQESMCLSQGLVDKGRRALRDDEGRGSPRQPSFVFLFNSGFLWRKGVDLLLAAYFGAFTANDNVKLVLHAVYGDAPVFENVFEVLRHAHGDPGRAPKVELLHEKLDSQGLSELFRSADVMVHPSRSEGFGLGVVEAMAQGIPVVLPDFGPPGELLSNDTAFLVPTRRSPCRLDPCSKDGLSIFTQDWPVPKPLEWGNYDPSELGAAMRRAYERPDEAKRVGERGREFVCRELTWGRIYTVMKERLLALAKKRRRRINAPSPDID